MAKHPINYWARRSSLRALVTLVSAAAFLLTLSAHAATIWWTGAGDGSSWEDAGNWSTSTVPGIDDIALLGYADSEGSGVANAAQNITLAGDTIVAQIQVFAEGDRAVTVSGGALLFATGNVPDRNTIVIDENAAHQTTFNSNLQINRRDSISHNAATELVINGNISATPQFIPDTATTFPGWNSGGWEFRLNAEIGNPMGVFRFQGSGSQSIGSTIVFAANGQVIYDNPLLTTPRLGSSANTTITFAQNTPIASHAVDAGVTAQYSRLGNEDILISGSGDISGGTSGILQIVPGEEGQGHLTLQAARLGGAETIASGGTGIGVGPAIVTAAESTVELVPHVVTRRRLISAADNDRISGEGNVRLSMGGAANDFEVYGVLTYTGRTMLESGILRLMSAGVESWQTGQLPVGTIVEIGSDATLDLNGIDQQIGGISDYNASAGSVLLGGATLTINSTSDSTFSGAVTGTGTIVKDGAATFTVNDNYTNPTGRTLRVANGTFAVNGTLSVVDGVFELSGGRVTATTLDATNVTWEVILAATAADQQMVAVTSADITDAILNLDLGQDYVPLVGTQFTLLYAMDTITGADSSNMFGYSDGSSIFVDGVEFTINWVTGSEAIVLTVIPEPGQMAALLGLIAIAVIVWRRRSV